MGRQIERGSSMAWTAILLAFVVLPLLMLVVDGARLFYVRGHLQTATDAACEDAAWSAGGRTTYRDFGTVGFEDEQAAINAAHATFAAILSDAASARFSAALVVEADNGANRMFCDGSANVPLMITAARFGSVTIRSSAVSMIRFVPFEP